ncbi:MAG: hypothetical protein OEZ43_05700 [Gammaproteobacteria bacterium]|nr:hypothetical protein [Gammaproteobacteria bacterium]
MFCKSALLTLCLTIAFISPTFAGETESIKTMANIMLHLNHYPSDAEKQQLSSIANSSTDEGVKTVAAAILNLEHAASAADKQRLQIVIDDDKTNQNIRTLASIVRNLNHKPSSEDKQQLSSMMSFAGN